MKKNAFTLIELLATVVILVVVFMIITPKLTRIVKDQETKQKELLKERITISSKLKSMKYLIQNKECDCFEKNDCFYIPITDLNFFYTKEERLMQTSLTVKLKVNLLKGHMPENLALLKILFH